MLSPRSQADEAWREQLHRAHIAAKVSSAALEVSFFDGKTQSELPATVLSASAQYDDFVVRLPDGVRHCGPLAHSPLPSLTPRAPAERALHPRRADPRDHGAPCCEARPTSGSSTRPCLTASQRQLAHS
jgi:hypothetical protein